MRAAEDAYCLNSENIVDKAGSRELAAFQMMNASLGNQEEYFGDIAVFHQDGKVLTSPPCHESWYNEVNVLVERPKMQGNCKQ